MSKYNLIRNGSLQALTTAGTGDKSLTWLQLESLMDGNTTSSGVTLTALDYLYLEADLSNRIKVDGIYLYASDLTKPSDVRFYYKDEFGDSYTLLTTQVSSYYYTVIPDPSAPRYIVATISGINIEAYEFQIFNDDIIVAFGEDGSEYAKYLENTPIGETGDPTTVVIYNNSTAVMPADAYVCIDWTGNDGDNYIKISSSVDGTYYGIDGGAIIEDDKDDSIYSWSMGEFDNTIVSGDNVVLIDPTISGGVYTSPIFGLDNKYMASYFITDGTTESGTTSISYNPNIYNGTIRVKSSDTKPLTIDEVYWLYRTAGLEEYVSKCIVYNGDQNNTWLSLNVGPIFGICVDKRNSDVIVNYYVSATGPRFLRKYDKDGNLLYTSPSFPIVSWDVNMECDKFGGLWGYSTSATAGSKYYLSHVDNEVDQILYQLGDGVTDFLYDLAVEMDGDGVWYTDQIENMVVHKDYEGTTLTTIILSEPRAICGTLDNGCWVIDNTDKKAYRYNSSGTLIKTVNIGRTASRMSSDMADGFWYIKGNYVYHVTSAGIEDISVNVPQPTKVRGGYNGCIVWSSDNDWVKYIDNDGNITRTFTISGVTNTVCPALFSFRYDDFKTFKNTTNIIPVSYDPVWGVGGSLSWKEVRKDGYFLPKTTYHQVEITLRCQGITSPALKKLIISPAIKVGDILPQTSKNIYVKTILPDGADVTSYESRLKAWWGIND